MDTGTLDMFSGIPKDPLTSGQRKSKHSYSGTKKPNPIHKGETWKTIIVMDKIT